VKSIDTLIDDIKALFEGEPHECDQERVKEFGQAVANMVAARLAEDRRDGPKTLRMSNLGKGDRQLWYEIKGGEPGEELSASTKLKFLFGDIHELMLIFLAEEAGHTVEHKQTKVNVNGVLGSMDAIIDGVVVDVKSASPFAFQKFKQAKLRDDDAFGYYEQLAGYVEGANVEAGGAWLAIEKVAGHLTLLKAPREELDALKIRDRITHMQEVLSSDNLPERCYSDEEIGKSGNRKLGVNCSYCPFKKKCWADSNGGIGLRTFIYSNGPVHFTHIEKEPNGPLEVTF
jgi:hypothetical protein